MQMNPFNFRISQDILIIYFILQNLLNSSEIDHKRE